MQHGNSAVDGSHAFTAIEPSRACQYRVPRVGCRPDLDEGSIPVLGRDHPQRGDDRIRIPGGGLLRILGISEMRSISGPSGPRTHRHPRARCRCPRRNTHCSRAGGEESACWTRSGCIVYRIHGRNRPATFIGGHDPWVEYADPGLAQSHETQGHSVTCSIFRQMCTKQPIRLDDLGKPVGQSSGQEPLQVVTDLIAVPNIRAC